MIYIVARCCCISRLRVAVAVVVVAVEVVVFVVVIVVVVFAAAVITKIRCVDAVVVLCFGVVLLHKLPLVHAPRRAQEVSGSSACVRAGVRG